MNGYAPSLWRLGRFDEAEAVMERMLALNPADDLGARLLLSARRDAVTWGAWSSAAPA